MKTKWVKQSNTLQGNDNPESKTTIIYTTSNNLSETIYNIQPQQIISSSERLSTVAIKKVYFPR